MSIQGYNKKSPAMGSSRKNAPHSHARCLTISFDSEMWEEIRQRAVRDNVGFSESARTLIQWGLDSEDET